MASLKRIVLQVGHMNAKFGEEWIKPQTGAPEEQRKNKDITFRAAEILRTKGIEVKVTDANGYKDPEVIQPVVWDLFLAVHCDADSAALSGGFTDFPEPKYDGATKLSQKYANKIAEKFYPETGIVYRPERRGNINVREYYFWDYISWTTPCVLIEMGESIDPHDDVILEDTERCAKALARGVCNALDIPFDVETPSQPVEEMITVKKSDWEWVNAKKNELSSALEQATKNVALAKEECQKTVQKIKDYINSI